MSPSAAQIKVALRRLARCRPPAERFAAAEAVLNNGQVLGDDDRANLINPWLMAWVLQQEACQWALGDWALRRFGQWVRGQGYHTGVLAPLQGWLSVASNPPFLAYNDATRAAITAWAMDAFAMLPPHTHPQAWLSQVNTPQQLACGLLMVVYGCGNATGHTLWPLAAWLQPPTNEKHRPEPHDALLRVWQQAACTLGGVAAEWPAITSISVGEIHRRLWQTVGSHGGENLAKVASHSQHLWESRPRYGMVVVEGMSETHVLPPAAKALGLTLAADGIDVVAAGGKSPMVGLVGALKSAGYLSPMAVLLDADGAAEAHTMAPVLGAADTLLCLPGGALEDTYSDDLLLAVINRYFNPVSPLTQADITLARSRGSGSDNLALLTDLFRYYELDPPDKPGPFDKVTFAQTVKEWLLQVCDEATLPSHRWVPAPLVALLTGHGAKVAQHRQAIHRHMGMVT